MINRSFITITNLFKIKVNFPFHLCFNILAKYLNFETRLIVVLKVRTIHARIIASL